MNRLSMKSPWIVGAVIAVTGLGITLLAEIQVTRQSSERIRASTLERLGAVQQRLQYSIDRRIYLGSGLVGYVVNDPDISEATFTRLAKVIGAGDKAIRSIQEN